VTQFLYDGQNLAAEYDAFGDLLRRYVHAPGTDDPEVWLEGSDWSSPHYLHKDAQGSVVAYSDGAGSVTSSQVYSYGAYGEPQAWGGSRFRYTGQIEIPEAQLYYYKARMYDPASGRFLETVFALDVEFAVPDLLFQRELAGPLSDQLLALGLRVEELHPAELRNATEDAGPRGRLARLGGGLIA
jgi:hypothetical protein